MDKNFNQLLNKWNVSNVVNGFYFFNASSFRQNIDNWKVKYFKKKICFYSL